MRVVVDTDVIVAAMRSPSGASAAILCTARQGKITLLVSVPLALEYEAICAEAEHRLDLRFLCINTAFPTVLISQFSVARVTRGRLRLDFLRSRPVTTRFLLKEHLPARAVTWALCEETS